MSAHRASWAAASALAAWLAGCQVIAPLPSAGGEGADPAGEGGGGESDGGADAGGGADASGSDGAGGEAGAGEATHESEYAPPPAPPPPAPEPPAPPPTTGPCEIDSCSTHCAQSMDRCELTPQYPSVEACCAVCEAMPSPDEYAGCRAVQSGDPVGCTAAGLLGPGDEAGCVGGCEALCTLYAALCPLGLASLDSCIVMCSLWPRPEVFNACGESKSEGTLGCRLQQLYNALDEPDAKKRERMCHDILQGRCPHAACER